MSDKPLKPGTQVPTSGIYREVGPRGGDQCRRVTAVAGKTLPPTTKSGHSYELEKGNTSRKGC